MSNRNKKIIIYICCAFIVAIIFYLFPHFYSTTMREAFIYFPEDDQIEFIDASTNIKLIDTKDENEYYLEWKTASETDKKAYLRQDIGFIFENGVLISTQSEWREKTKKLKNKVTLHGEDSGRYEAITFHFAEVHYPDDIIKSKQIMTEDKHYVIDTPLSPLVDFKKAKSQSEQRGKELLDSIIDQQLTYTVEGLIEQFKINKESYHIFPLTEIAQFQTEPLPSMSQEETNAVIGRMWEGLYRYYLLGTNTFTEETYDPIGNTMPFVFLSKDDTHLLVLYETADKKGQQLLQLIPKSEDNENLSKNEQ
ncbi:hypothetical protein LGQ02_07315 [Bacillus shivajii]|uniref:hypothetical protein n=1 Tax=Bacillus shivajii TaxID=1983719 RepID=UPI001CF99E60|nr:hypothetical protein [Bacillus shivajii]UCZ54556.1 hypothetical protein LGQ02_07315 [Bacillus shivajii]